MEVDGYLFASRREAHRYSQLKLLEASGAITDLELQPKFPIIVNGVKVCTYVADFQYNENGAKVTEDVKGFSTPVYRLKKKLMKAVYDIDILES